MAAVVELESTGKYGWAARVVDLPRRYIGGWQLPQPTKAGAVRAALRDAARDGFHYEKALPSEVRKRSGSAAKKGRRSAFDPDWVARNMLARYSSAEKARSMAFDHAMDHPARSNGRGYWTDVIRAMERRVQFHTPISFGTTKGQAARKRAVVGRSPRRSPTHGRRSADPRMARIDDFFNALSDPPATVRRSTALQRKIYGPLIKSAGFAAHATGPGADYLYWGGEAVSEIYARALDGNRTALGQLQAAAYRIP